MTQAQLERNSKAGRARGKALMSECGSEYFRALGKKGGSAPKTIKYQSTQNGNRQNKDERGKLLGHKLLLEALSNKVNLRIGGLPIARNAVYPRQ